MSGARYEEYEVADNGLPFVLHVELERTPYLCSREQNWHEDIELQLCVDGCGTVLLDGERYCFEKDDVAVINSNSLHYTGTDNRLCYTCLIVRAGFCRQMGIDYTALRFSPIARDSDLVRQINELVALYRAEDEPYRVARLTALLLALLISLVRDHAHLETSRPSGEKTPETVKAALRYIRENSDRRVSLDEIARFACVDKFALCRAFKKFTGYALGEYSNRYRCRQAVEYLSSGHTVAETAALCGFDNLSFFTKTFKRYMGALPSQYKKS